MWVESLRVIIICRFKVAVFSWMRGGDEKHPKYIIRWRLSSLKKPWYVSRFCINISKLIPKYWWLNNFPVHTMYIFTPAQPFRSLCFGCRIIEGSVSPKSYSGHLEGGPFLGYSQAGGRNSLCCWKPDTPLAPMDAARRARTANSAGAQQSAPGRPDPLAPIGPTDCSLEKVMPAVLFPRGWASLPEGISLLAVGRMNCTNESVWACSKQAYKYPAGLMASSSVFHGLLSGADWLHCQLSGSACLSQGLERLPAVGKIGKGVGRDMDGALYLGEEETQSLKTGCCCCSKKPDQREGKKKNCIHRNTEHFSACWGKSGFHFSLFM